MTSPSDLRALEPGKTRVHIPGYGNGLIIAIVPERGRDLHGTWRRDGSDLVIVLVDGGLRVARTPDELEPEQQEPAQ